MASLKYPGQHRKPKQVSAVRNKVVFNACFGGFSLSREACQRLIDLGCPDADEHGCRDVSRHDPLLVHVVEAFGEKANGSCAILKIAEIEGDRYRIDEYDGSETVVVPNEAEWTVIK